jgi:formylglycine-generating enzyme required for sulfatase activity
MFCGPRAHSGGPQPSLRVLAGAQPSVFERLAGGEMRVSWTGPPRALPSCWRRYLPRTAFVAGRHVVSGASSFGLLGMAGNVDEWVRDRYRRYPAPPSSCPRTRTGRSIPT